MKNAERFQYVSNMTMPLIARIRVLSIILLTGCLKCIETEGYNLNYLCQIIESFSFHVNPNIYVYIIATNMTNPRNLDNNKE
jgi:ABC-type polysaccharide transport system permease subunit